MNDFVHISTEANTISFVWLKIFWIFSL
jgi:hypothetical protein